MWVSNSLWKCNIILPRIFGASTHSCFTTFALLSTLGRVLAGADLPWSLFSAKKLYRIWTSLSVTKVFVFDVLLAKWYMVQMMLKLKAFILPSVYSFRSSVNLWVSKPLVLLSLDSCFNFSKRSFSLESLPVELILVDLQWNITPSNNIKRKAFIERHYFK